MQFVDECVIELKAGNGGNGVIAWRREAHTPNGGPYGGDGGDGGDIVLVGDNNTNSLLQLRNHKIIKAQNGENGKTKLASGKNGANYEINVPLGTVVYDLNNNKICEILKHGEKKVVCHGGKGGHGNGWFKNPDNKIPNLHENGDIGESLNAKLVIKYMADVGLVGLPNAGKSTLVGAVSSAKPKVANYQFTTLTPVLGICKYKDQKIVFADIPGLIAGAAEGKGLGHEFLKHIERCSILIHLISLDSADNLDVIDSYKTINNELKNYKEELTKKPMLIVANKCDIENSDKQLKILKKHLAKKKIINISAKNKTNLDELLDKVYSLFIKHKQKLQEQDKNKKEIKVIELRKLPDYEQDLQIIKQDEGVWKITSKYIEYWSNRIPLDTQDNIMRYNQKLKNLKIEDKVKQMGAKIGDTLLIYNNQLILE